MVTFVESTQVLNVNGDSFYNLNFTTGVVTGITRNINAANSVIVGAQWMMPRVAQGLPLVSPGFEYAVAVNAIPPTVDAVKVLVVKETLSQGAMNVYKIAIANTDYVGGVNVFGTLADGLGGALATMPVVTIPFPLIQDAPVTTSTTAPVGVNTFVFPFPTNPNALTYSIPQVWFNGVIPATPYAPGGITTAALFVTWVNSNWGAYGTWSHIGNIVELASAPVTSPVTNTVYVTAAGLIVSLQPASFCLDLTSLYPTGEINATTLGVGGTGYVIGNTFTINNSTSGAQLATGTVTGVSGGVVTTYTVDTKGSLYSAASGVATTATSGSGTGLTITISSVRTAAGATVNGVGFGVSAPVPFGAFVLTNTNAGMAQLITSITPFFEDGATFAIGGTGGTKITVTTVQPTPTIYNGSSAVITAGSGACS